MESFWREYAEFTQRVPPSTNLEFAGERPEFQPESPLHYDPLATLSIFEGLTSAPILCYVVVSPDSVVAHFSRPGDIDGKLADLARQSRQASPDSSPAPIPGWSEFYQQCQSIVIRTIRCCCVRSPELSRQSAVGCR